MNDSRIISKALATFIFIFANFVSQAFGATYYIAATGGSDSNSGISRSQPWATFTNANSALVPGDTLIVLSGTYNQAIVWTKSGTNGNPITIKADVDGSAIVDGQNARRPLRVWGVDTSNRVTDVVFDGLVFRNSNGEVIDLNWTQRLTFKRISAYDSPAGGNYTIITNWQSSNNLFEDCAASGNGRKAFITIGSDFTTVRRCWFRFVNSTDPGPTGMNPTYGSRDGIIENTVTTSDGTVPSTYDHWSHWTASGAKADRNKYYGNVLYGASGSNFAANTHDSAITKIQDNEYNNHVIINPGKDAFYQRADANLKFRNCTFVGTPQTVFWVDVDPTGKDADFTVAYDMRNCVLSGGTVGFDVESHAMITSHVNQYNDLYNITTKYTRAASAGVGEVSIDPQYDTAKYGKGAYLIRPAALKGKGEAGADMGAEVLYLYQNGVLTNVPLWPWPMEDRIFKETGVSVTWEANGGLWKTLDGVYSGGTPPPPPAARPLPPTGLIVQ